MRVFLDSCHQYGFCLLKKKKSHHSVTFSKGRNLPGSLFVKSTNTCTWTTAVSESQRKLSSGLAVSCSCTKEHLDTWYNQDTKLRVILTYQCRRIVLDTYKLLGFLRGNCVFLVCCYNVVKKLVFPWSKFHLLRDLLKK